MFTPIVLFLLRISLSHTHFTREDAHNRDGPLCCQSNSGNSTLGQLESIDRSFQNFFLFFILFLLFFLHFPTGNNPPGILVPVNDFLSCFVVVCCPFPFFAHFYFIFFHKKMVGDISWQSVTNQFLPNLITVRSL